MTDLWLVIRVLLVAMIGGFIVSFIGMMLGLHPLACVALSGLWVWFTPDILGVDL